MTKISTIVLNSENEYTIEDESETTVKDKTVKEKTKTKDEKPNTEQNNEGKNEENMNEEEEEVGSHQLLTTLLEYMKLKKEYSPIKKSQ